MIAVLRTYSNEVGASDDREIIIVVVISGCVLRERKVGAILLNESYEIINPPTQPYKEKEEKSIDHTWFFHHANKTQDL